MRYSSIMTKPQPTITPSPWELLNTGAHGWSIKSTKTGTIVAREGSCFHDQRLPNMTLMSKAPELLEQLELVVSLGLVNPIKHPRMYQTITSLILAANGKGLYDNQRAQPDSSAQP